jgi:hypothetical protein
MDRHELHLPLKLALIDPYELRIKDAKGINIGKIYLDDAPVQDYNNRQWAYAKMMVDGANVKPFDLAALEEWLKHGGFSLTDDEGDCVREEFTRDDILDKIAELKGKS